MATVMDRACDDELVDRCDGCGGVLEEPWGDESLVIYDCFHALHAGCAYGRDACPRCDTPRRVHDDDDDQPEQVEAAPASPPDNRDKDSALASEGVGNDDDRPGCETGELRPSRCDGDFIKPGDGESPASVSVSGCKCIHASRLGCCACCSRRVTELEGRLEEKSAALTETTNVLESELERAQSCLCRLEKMYDKLEEFIRLRNDKRVRAIEDAEEEEEAAAERLKERFKVPTRPH